MPIPNMPKKPKNILMRKSCNPSFRIFAITKYTIADANGNRPSNTNQSQIVLPDNFIIVISAKTIGNAKKPNLMS